MQREVHPEGVVPDSWTLTLTVQFEVNQMERFELFEVRVDLADVPTDKSRCLANTLWLVLYNRSE